MEVEKSLAKGVTESNVEKPKSPCDLTICAENSSETENKTEVDEAKTESEAAIDNEVEQHQPSPKAIEENAEVVLNADEGEISLEKKESATIQEDEIDLHKSKSIESIAESDTEEIAHAIEDDEEEEAAEESAYEEELIEDTDPEDRDSENAVVLSSDDDDEDDINVRHVQARRGDTSQTDDEYDDEYDDNDLMDSVILSSKNNAADDNGISENKKRKRSERDSTEERECESKAGDNRLDWRADLKKRLKSG